MKRFLAAAAVAALCSPAGAALITLDFEDSSAFRDPGGSLLFTSNATYGGFRFSPNCHIDALGPGGTLRGYLNSSWIGFDTSGCASAYNGEFLGPDEYQAGRAPAGLYVDHFGDPFSLVGVYMNFMGMRILTSKGGLYTVPVPLPPAGYPLVTFNSPLFNDVHWIMFLDVGMGAPVGIDQLTLSIPEPTSGSLVLLAIAGLLASCRGTNNASRYSSQMEAPCPA